MDAGQQGSLGLVGEGKGWRVAMTSLEVSDLTICNKGAEGAGL